MAHIKTTSHSSPLAMTRLSSFAVSPKRSAVSLRHSGPVDTFETGVQGLDSGLTQAKKLGAVKAKVVNTSGEHKFKKPSFLNRIVDVSGFAAVALIGGIESLLGGKGRITDLKKIDSGQEIPDPNSRLGAYHATKGYPEGTLGHAAHEAIGTIYALLGTVGEEEIGKVFNSPAAKALYDDPVDGPSSKKLAQMEFDYWVKMKKEKNSFGGHLGSLFNPESRDWLQREFFR